MSVAAVAWAFEQKLPANEKIVLLSLADCENGQTALCIPGQERLAEMSSMSVRSVRRMLEKLEQRGLIQREHRTSAISGYRTSDSYVLARFQPANLTGEAGPTGQIVQANRPTVAGIGEPEVEPEDTPPTPSAADEHDIVSEWFEEAWKSWPRKDGKAAAKKAWLKASRLHERAVRHGEVPGAPADTASWGMQALLRDTVKRFAAAYQRTTAPKFIPHLSSWLNQERWTDPLPVDQTRGAHKPEPQQAATPKIPFGHRPVWKDGYIVGSEPIE